MTARWAVRTATDRGPQAESQVLLPAPHVKSLGKPFYGGSGGFTFFVRFVSFCKLRQLYDKNAEFFIFRKLSSEDWDLGFPA